MNVNEHEPTEQLLTQALRDEAAGVQPSPGGLQTIQQRTVRGARSQHRWVWAAGAASLATAAVVTGIVVMSNDDGGGSGATGAPIVDQPREAEVTPIFQVWFYGPQPGNPEGPGPGDPSTFAPLYVEQHIEDPTPGSPAEQAVRAFLTSGPIDPDYSTGWPSGVDVEQVTKDAGDTTIELTGTPDLASRGDLTSGQANSAVQALLRTAGASGDASFTYNGEPLDTLFGMATPIEVLPYGPSASMDSLRAPISVDLTNGQPMDNPVMIPVTGNVFEGTVNWELLDDAGAVVDDGFVTAGTMAWATVDAELGNLDPGTYTFRAFEVSVADGDENYVDTKTFVVE